MAQTHFYETSFQIGSKTILIFAEYTFRPGSPASGPTFYSGGEPGDPAEIEFGKIEINTTDDDPETAKSSNYFEAPEWLCTIVANDDDIYQEILAEDHSYQPEYEPD